MSAALDKYMGQWRQYKVQLSLLFLVIIYLVGVVGISTDFRELVLPLTPVTLLISTSILLAHQAAWRWTTALMAAVAFLVGYLIEVAGVHTGVIFGEYWYGATLGPKVAEVPLTIGVNWLLLVFASGSFVASRSWPVPVKAIVSASLMVGLDVLIEPVAVKLDFWNWAGGEIPLQNYLAWWGIAFLLHLLYHSLRFEKTNKVAFGLFIIQIVFFGILNLTV